MILGYNTNGLAHHELVQAIDLLASIGYRGVAITLDHGALNPYDPQLPQRVERVRTALQRHRMAVVIETGARYLLDPRRKHEPTLVSSRSEERQRRGDFLSRAIDIGCELSARCVSLWSGVVHDSARPEEVEQRLVEGLLPVLRHAAERGMSLGFEPEPGMFVDTLAAYGKLLQRLGEHVPAELPKLTVDIGHLHCQGETPIAGKLREWADQIVNIHIEDMREGVHEHLMFGEGEIDFPPILAMLAKIGYNGPLNVELSRHSHCGPEAAAQAYWFLAPRVDAAANSQRTTDHGPRTMHVVLLSIPGLRNRDLGSMPNLSALARDGERAALTPSFPAVTCPVQANMTTGCLPREHGVVANGFFWRDRGEVEMWTAWNDCIGRPQLWDLLHEHDSSLTSAVWFPLHSKGCGADYICTPAPVHNPDGSESLWCYTRPEAMYGELRDALGHFPLKHFWGPLAGIQSTAWIAASAVSAAERYRPNLFYIYLPHLDYAAQKYGPDSPQAMQSLVELDAEIGKLVAGVEAAYGERPLWIVASEYTIVPVSHVTYPNRVLREASLLAMRDEEGRELLDVANSPAWALADHQFSHIFVRDRDAATIGKVADLFRNQTGIAEVLAGDERAKYALDHERSGDVVLISTPDSWQAYYWWLDDARAPAFAHTVDIHRKPGYDPVELFFDPVKKGIPLDATLVKGSHGAPVLDDYQRGVILTSVAGVLETNSLTDAGVAEIVLRQFT